jgi:hypothetical protein
MSNEMKPPAGFARPCGRDRSASHRLAMLQLLASLTLAFSTLVAATVVTIGYARADALSVAADDDGGRFGVALLVSLLFAGMGGLTALMARDR